MMTRKCLCLSLPVALLFALATTTVVNAQAQSSLDAAVLQIQAVGQMIADLKLTAAQADAAANQASATLVGAVNAAVAPGVLPGAAVPAVPVVPAVLPAVPAVVPVSCAYMTSPYPYYWHGCYPGWYGHPGWYGYHGWHGYPGWYGRAGWYGRPGWYGYHGWRGHRWGYRW